MSFYRSRPITSISELHDLYATTDNSQIPVYNTLRTAKHLIDEIYSYQNTDGYVISIEGSWGVGKTSFMNLLEEAIDKNKNISSVYFDSLYYGNASEATEILMGQVFSCLRNEFGVHVSDDSQIIKNITPEFELTNGIPKLSLKFKKPRKSTEVILRQNLQSNLKRMNGKLIITIDDIDRLPAAEALHFLRVVRVLKELPNIIILLPIDRENLERLIRSQDVPQPKAYLQKIIDRDFNLNPDLGNSRQLMHRLINRKYESRGVVINEQTLNMIWHLMLWEITLIIIRQFESDANGRRLIVGTNPGETEPWGLINEIGLANGDNIIRKFFERTSDEYGGMQYYMRVNRPANPNGCYFRSYRKIAGTVSFTDFILGTYYKDVLPNEEDFSGLGQTMFDVHWWSRVNLENLPNIDTKPEDGNRYDFIFLVNEDNRANVNQQILQHSNTIWDVVSDLAEAYLPPQAYQYLSPRVLNKIVQDFEYDSGLSEGETRAELQRRMRKTVRAHVDYKRDV